MTTTEFKQQLLHTQLNVCEHIGLTAEDMNVLVFEIGCLFAVSYCEVAYKEMLQDRMFWAWFSYKWMMDDKNTERVYNCIEWYKTHKNKVFIEDRTMRVLFSLYQNKY